MTDQIATLLERQSLTQENAAEIARALSEAEDGKLTVSMSFKLTRTKDRLFCKSTLAFSQKFTSESEDSIAVSDPQQPKLI